MGAVPSTQARCAAQNIPVSCQTPGLGQFKPDPDIVGIGVIQALAATVFCTLSCSTILLALDVWDLFVCFQGRERQTSYEKLEKWLSQDCRERGRRVLEAVVVSFSDQQLVTGLSMVIATRFYRSCDISTYHYNVVCSTVLKSLITHLSSLAVTRSYFRNRVLGSLRSLLIGFMFITAVFVFQGRHAPHFPIGVPAANSTAEARMVLPAVCSQSHNASLIDDLGTGFRALRESIRKEDKRYMQRYNFYIIVVIFFVFVYILMEFQSHITRKYTRDPPFRWRKIFFGVRLVMLIAAWVITRKTHMEFRKLRDWMQGSGWLMDHSEDEWTFGQLLPCWLMLLAPLAFLEAWVDKWKPSRIREVGEA